MATLFGFRLLHAPEPDAAVSLGVIAAVLDWGSALGAWCRGITITGVGQVWFSFVGSRPTPYPSGQDISGVFFLGLLPTPSPHSEISLSRNLFLFESRYHPEPPPLFTPEPA